MSTVYNDPIMLDSTGQDIVTKLDSIASLMGDGVIDDTSTATDTTWSSNKITSELAGKQDELTFDHTPKDDSLNPVYSDGIYDSIIGVYDNLELGLGWDSKNILGIANTSKEVNGITFTVNDDGTVKLNGTATSATLYALNKFTGAELKKYGENLLMTGGKDNSTFLTLMTQDWAYTKDDKGNGVEINISELTDATEYTVIIQIANGTTLSNYIMSPMIRLANVIDPSFKKHHDSVDVIKADKVNVIANTKLIKDTVGWSGKNKLKIDLATIKTLNGTGTWSGNTYAHTNGITFTVNADGTITANGTASGGNCSITISNVQFGNSNISTISGSESNEEFIISDGLPISGQGFSSYVMATNKDVPNVYIYVANGQTLNNVVFKPMIREVGILDDTYEPYFGSTAVDWSSYAVLGAKNRFKPTISNTTSHDVVLTNVADNGLNINGTNDSSSNISFILGKFYPSTLKAGTYKITTGGDADIDNYFIGFDAKIGDTWVKSLISLNTVNNGTFTVDWNGYDNIAVVFVVRGNKTVNNKTFYIMVYDSADTSSTYQPYAMTNKELTDEVTPIRTEATASIGTSSGDVSLNEANYKSIVKVGKVVYFNVRFTLNTATGTGDTRLVNLGYAPDASYPLTSLRKRQAPYEEVCGLYINPSGEVSSYGIALPPDDYWITGTYVCK